MTDLRAPAIHVDDLRKSYRDLEVLSGISFLAERGSVFCLLGSNGAGKTTAVRILSTRIAADAGEIRICGIDARRFPAKLRRLISVTGQFSAVDELLTGRENLLLAGDLFHVHDTRRRADSLLAQFELSDAASRRVAAYSGGMRRKLDIAMSLMGDPQLLFLDEPTTGLDPQSRLAMWQEIEKLKTAGITIFLTTQYLEEAERLADQVAILHNGLIVQSGTVGELTDMLPGGSVAISLEPEDYPRATALFRGRGMHQVMASQQESSVTVMTDGSVAQLTDLLVTLRAAGIEARSVAQQEPRLEDVYLAQVTNQITNNGGEG